MLLPSPLSVEAQGTQTEFGQNRVQYKDFVWSYYETDKFVTYFYQGGQDIGKFVIQFAEEEIDRIEERLEYNIDKRIMILVYNDLSDLNQTNIGQGLDLYNTGGVTKIIENKMFIYFNGNHEDLKEQIREGIARIFLNHMMFGGNLQEILQNAVLLNLPEWFTSGLASYIGEPWSVEMDNRLRDGILSGKYQKFSKLTGEDARFAGHAMWHYVEEKYGKSAVSNLLYLTRINRSLESGFLFVLGGSVKSVTAEWYDYYYDHYTHEKSLRDAPADSNRIWKKRKKKWHHYQPRLSSDGIHVAYATNQMGRFKVRLLNTEEQKTKVILRGGVKTNTLVTDYSYPLLSWSPDGKTLGVIYEKRDKLYLLAYNLETKDKITAPITKFQQIHSFRFTDDPRLLVMSASQRGQSDIFTYYIPTTLVEQITNDYYDDLDAAYINVGGKRGIIFSSNRNKETFREERIDTILPNNSFDLFFYDLDNRSNKLLQVTHSDYFTEEMPMQYNDSIFTFLSDDNGIKNRYAGYFKEIFDKYDTVYYFPDSTVTNPGWDYYDIDISADSIRLYPVYKDTAITYPITNYYSNIVEHDISPGAGKSLDMFYENSLYDFYISDLDDPSKTNSKELENTFYQNHILGQVQRMEKFQEEKKKVTAQIEEGLEEEKEQEEEEPFFQSDFNTAPEINVEEYIDGTMPGKEPIFKFSRVAPYQVKFSTDYVLTQLDNSIIMTRYEKFTPGVPVYNTPPLSFMMNLGISDLFEDHRITGGFRFPFDFNGSEYFIAYDNFKKRLDKRFMYYRKVDEQTYSDVVPFYNIPISPVSLPVETKIKTNYFETKLTFPFDVVRSLRWSLAYRHDNFVFLSKDDFSHNLPNYTESWVYAKAEYVFDNTIKIGLNLYNGVRFKVFAEIHKEILFQQDTIFNNLKLKLPKFNDAYLGVVGFDFRWYQKVHKNIVWANRFAWGSSFGTRKLIYYLGGVDNWISPKFDQSTPISEDQNYAFQTLATNLRGFDQNVRNGNSYMLLNSELRVPIFSYLTNSTIKSEFIRNFQVLGFVDMGTAWEGINPWDEENPLFTDVIGQDPVTVTVEYFKNPVVFGYGFGIRSSLFGYFIRMDLAWGNDSGVKTDSPKLYFSLSLDF